METEKLIRLYSVIKGYESDEDPKDLYDRLKEFSLYILSELEKSHPEKKGGY